MSRLLHRMQVLLLALFAPVHLFHHINQLPWYRNTLREWVDGLGYTSNDVILEAGCATGQLSRHLAQRGAHVEAVDRSASMIQRAVGNSDSGVRFHQADIMSLPYPDASFDFVVSASVVNLLDEPETAIQELQRVCKPGGKISVLVPSSSMTATQFDQLQNRLSLSGFSSAALFMWNKMARKMDGNALCHQFKVFGMKDVWLNEYLDGMVIEVTGIVPDVQG